MSQIFEQYKLKEFCEANNVSKYNQDIVTEYIKLVTRKVRSKNTILYNVQIMKFLVTCVETDLDKMTKKDINCFIDTLNDWCRKTDGKPISDATKKQYQIGLVRFLRHWGEETDNSKLIELAKFNFGKIRLTRKLPEDLLSKDDIDSLVAAADTTMEKALIAILYESGARRGEIEHCRIKDVIPNPNGFHIRLDGKTGHRQVLVHLYQTYLRDWLNDHPVGNNPNAPLFGKFKGEKFIPLDGGGIHYRIKKTAVKIGLKKRCYPHLFRHSIATTMAKTLSEQQLKVRFGWDPASTVVADYVHLSGKDVDDTLLETYGIVTKKKDDGSKVNVCVRCGMQVTPGIRFCSNCGQPMTKEAQDSVNLATTDFTTFINKNPELMQKLMLEIQKNLQEISQ